VALLKNRASRAWVAWAQGPLAELGAATVFVNLGAQAKDHWIAAAPRSMRLARAGVSRSRCKSGYKEKQLPKRKLGTEPTSWPARKSIFVIGTAGCETPTTGRGTSRNFPDGAYQKDVEPPMFAVPSLAATDGRGAGGDMNRKKGLGLDGVSKNLSNRGVSKRGSVIAGGQPMRCSKLLALIGGP